MNRTALALIALPLTLIAALGPAAANGRPAAKAPAAAPSVAQYDGRWSVEVITQTGDCDRAYRYAILIENGQARYGSNDFDVKGRVQPTGAVAASISRGSDSANVVGQLADGQGSGTWSTSGARSCGGVWNAERRG